MEKTIEKIFNTSSSGEKSEAVKKLIDQSTPNTDFFMMVVLSIAMATFGLLLDNTAIVIGAMLIAPVLSPILSLGMGIVMFNESLIRRAVFTLGKSLLYAIGAAFLIGLLFGSKDGVSVREVLSRTTPNLLDAAVAVVAGFAASFALIKPKMSEAIPGIAISVSLVPPLAVTGLGLATLNFAIAKGAFLLFVVNILGIIFASVFVFSSMNLYTKRGTADRAIKDADKVVDIEKDEDIIITENESKVSQPLQKNPELAKGELESSLKEVSITEGDVLNK
ncbi:TIGR00341 family protein [Candidatus Parcubacteria bacterium]|nr:TIGR00341 family protein [Candidatus Parcubacteria bacterium]